MLLDVTWRTWTPHSLPYLLFTPILMVCATDSSFDLRIGLRIGGFTAGAATPSVHNTKLSRRAVRAFSRLRVGERTPALDFGEARLLERSFQLLRLEALWNAFPRDE
jgi:hypothetical protein